jgi:hypothetical protein
MTVMSGPPTMPHGSGRVTVPVPARVRRGNWFLILVTLLEVLLLILVAALPWYLFRPESISPAPSTQVPALTGQPFVSPSPKVHPPNRPSSGKGIVGAAYTQADDVREMMLLGLPFAFDVPSSWGCLGAKSPNAAAWRCIDEQGGAQRSQVDLRLRHCPGPCTQAQRAEVGEGLAYGSKATVIDPATRVSEGTVAGRYYLTLDRVLSPPPAGPGEWVVVVAARAEQADASTVQKIVNDIYVQTR